mgnify:CR=1 FL=1
MAKGQKVKKFKYFPIEGTEDYSEVFYGFEPTPTTIENSGNISEYFYITCVENLHNHFIVGDSPRYYIRKFPRSVNLVWDDYMEITIDN